ncbi:MAG TPA: sulfatase-like hydrolase/transferase, partial [Opitutales bacterium]|nr:sulfatase-like hydrolase/transferase [Opitutales bacterium]
SHESRIFPEKKPKERRVPIDAIATPPYQTGTPETIDDWRAYYERLEQMDAEVGRLLKELEASGEADDTIIVYCSDHGGVTLRSKRYLYDSGTRVPLIVSFPEKWQHLAPLAPGSASERLVQFIDLPKTFLSLLGVEPPGVMPGRVFLGEDVEPAPESVFLFSGRFDEAPDNSRAVTDGRWKYIRNFEPDRPLFQMLNYPMRQAGQVSQWEAYQAGATNDRQSAHYLPQQAEELYDTESDPHEVDNLAASEPEKLHAMRARLRSHILETHDLGFIPEPMMEAINVLKTQTVYSYGQNEENYPLPRILDLAILASEGNPANQSELVRAFGDGNPIIRYWALVGLRVLGARAQDVDQLLEEALADPAPSVRIQAAICLARQGRRERALGFLLHEAQTAYGDIHAAWALDGIKLLDAPEVLDGLGEAEVEGLKKGFNSKRIVNLLHSGGSVSRMPE